MTHSTRPRFGIATAPQQVDYADILRVWREADTIPQIEHAWLFDHLMPNRGRPERADLRRLDTSVGPRRADRTAAPWPPRDQQPHPAAGGAGQDRGDRRRRVRRATRVRHRAGQRTDIPSARREYDMHGLPYEDAAHAVGSLAEAFTVIRKLWTETEPFDFHGTYINLTGAFCNPKPVQRPHPPITIGGRSAATLRVVAEHADVWNVPGGDIDEAVRRGELLERFCAEIGRDPASITRSIPLPVSYDKPSTTRNAIDQAVTAGCRAHCPELASALSRQRRAMGRRGDRRSSTGGSRAGTPAQKVPPWSNDAPMSCQGSFGWHGWSIFGVGEGIAFTGLLGADKTGKGHSGGGQALMRSRGQQGRRGSGDGRRIVSRPARVRQPISGSGRPGGLGVSRRRGGGGRPRGRRSASGSG